MLLIGANYYVSVKINYITKSDQVQTISEQLAENRKTTKRRQTRRLFNNYNVL